MRRTPEVFGSRENTNKHGCNGRLQHIFSSSSYTGGVLHLHILPRPAFNRYRRAYHQVSCFLQLLSIQQVAKKRGPKPPGTSFTVTSAAPPCHPCVVTSRARLFSQPFGAAEALFLALFRAAGTSSFNLSMRSRDRHLPMHHPRAHFGKKKIPLLSLRNTRCLWFTRWRSPPFPSPLSCRPDCQAEIFYTLHTLGRHDRPGRQSHAPNISSSSSQTALRFWVLFSTFFFSSSLLFSFLFCLASQEKKITLTVNLTFHSIRTRSFIYLIQNSFGSFIHSLSRVSYWGRMVSRKVLSAVALFSTLALAQNNNNNNNGQNNNNNNNGGDATQLAPNAVQSGSFFDGSDAIGANDAQAQSDVSQNNFINFCAGQTLTNGLQLVDGSCNGIRESSWKQTWQPDFLS